MKATIEKILPFKKSVNGNSYLRIFMLLEDGRFVKTDICPDYRNYLRWKRIARLGNKIRIENFEFKDNDFTVNADSWPYLIEGKLRGSGEKMKLQELKKLFRLGVFG